MQYLKKVNNVIEIITGIFFLVMTVVVLLQVFFRYVLNKPVAEFLEIAIYAMVYLVMLGCTIAVYKKTHIAVGYFVGKLPPRLKKFSALLVYAIMMAFFGILLVQGYYQTVRSMSQASPATGLPVGYVMLSMPVSSAISLLYLAEQFVKECRKRNATEPSC